MIGWKPPLLALKSLKSSLNLDLFVNRQPLDHLLKLRKKTSCASTFRTIDHLVTPISPLKHGEALWMMKTEDD